ncbi:MAG TPA: hypothetical protein VD903_18060 [Pseudonocardia sp.]|nr:hypothetical protein [Pseudonocardia sp.]
MDGVLFAAFALGYALLLGWGAVLVRRHGMRAPADVLLPVILALVYDNGVLAAGRLIGEGPLLEGLNVARYWLHALLTPLLVLFAWDAMGRAGLAAARRSWAWALAVALYLAAVVVELAGHVLGLSLRPRRQYGVLSYAVQEPAAGPPVMILVVSAVLLLAAAVVWWKQRWPWFAVGVVLMSAGGAVPLPLDSAAVTNAFEFLLLASLLATKQRQDRLAAGAASPIASPH